MRSVGCKRWAAVPTPFVEPEIPGVPRKVLTTPLLSALMMTCALKSVVKTLRSASTVTA
jgi:hypothetical protein